MRLGEPRIDEGSDLHREVAPPVRGTVEETSRAAAAQSVHERRSARQEHAHVDALPARVQDERVAALDGGVERFRWRFGKDGDQPRERVRGPTAQRWRGGLELFVALLSRRLHRLRRRGGFRLRLCEARRLRLQRVRDPRLLLRRDDPEVVGEKRRERRVFHPAPFRDLEAEDRVLPSLVGDAEVEDVRLTRRLRQDEPTRRVFGVDRVEVLFVVAPLRVEDARDDLAHRLVLERSAIHDRHIPRSGEGKPCAEARREGLSPWQRELGELVCRERARLLVSVAAEARAPAVGAELGDDPPDERVVASSCCRRRGLSKALCRRLVRRGDVALA